MIVLLFGTHVFLSIRLRFPQRKLLTAIKLSVTKDNKASGDVSQFAALSTALAATIGTGNIVGVATAISLGGPGAVFWCWLSGFFGIATKYGESLLSVKYRTKTPDGRILGGPMFVLEKGLGQKWLGIVFAVCTALAVFGIGTTVQANAISVNVSSLLNNIWNEQYLRVAIGVILAVLVGIVIIGGVKSIANVCMRVVPLMAIVYIIACLLILVMNHAYLIDAVVLIVKQAFSIKATVGGAAGTAIMLGARYGIARGLFSNESGT